MSNFRLKVFVEVKKQLNFSKASEALFISQPAVSKHINALEDELGVSLFYRNKQGVELTPEGEIYAEFAEEILNLYEEGKFKMNEFRNYFEGSFKIGASTTIAQYFLPEILPQFVSKYKGIKLSLFNANTQEIEHLLLDKKIDLGFIEGISGKPQLKYTEIGKDELVCIANPKHALAKKEWCSVEEILKYTWVMREQGSGSLDVLNSYLKQEGIKKTDLDVEAYLGSTESIKSYVRFSNCLAFVSIHSVKDELLNGKLKNIDIENFEVLRSFYAVEQQGATKNIPQLFLNFINNNKK